MNIFNKSIDKSMAWSSQGKFDAQSDYMLLLLTHDNIQGCVSH